MTEPNISCSFYIVKHGFEMDFTIRGENGFVCRDFGKDQKIKDIENLIMSKLILITEDLAKL